MKKSSNYYLNKSNILSRASVKIKPTTIAPPIINHLHFSNMPTRFDNSPLIIRISLSNRFSDVNCMLS